MVSALCRGANTVMRPIYKIEHIFMMVNGF